MIDIVHIIKRKIMSEIKTKEQLKRQGIRAFQNEMKQYLLTSRFTNATFDENREYRIVQIQLQRKYHMMQLYLYWK